jgi:hypothetical protein
MEAGKLANGYGPTKVPSAALVDQVLKQVEAGNRFPARDNRPASFATLYAYCALEITVAKVLIAQLDRATPAKRNRLLPAIERFVANQPTTSPILLAVKCRFDEMFVKEVLKLNPEMTPAERRAAAKALRRMVDPPSAIAYAIRSDYDAYLATARAQARDPKSLRPYRRRGSRPGFNVLAKLSGRKGSRPQDVQKLLSGPIEAIQSAGTRLA